MAVCEFQKASKKSSKDKLVWSFVQFLRIVLEKSLVQAFFVAESKSLTGRRNQ
jgi:hypothetical protein